MRGGDWLWHNRPADLPLFQTRRQAAICNQCNPWWVFGATHWDCQREGCRYESGGRTESAALGIVGGWQCCLRSRGIGHCPCDLHHHAREPGHPAGDHDVVLRLFCGGILLSATRCRVQLDWSDIGFARRHSAGVALKALQLAFTDNFMPVSWASLPSWRFGRDGARSFASRRRFAVAGAIGSLSLTLIVAAALGVVPVLMDQRAYTEVDRAVAPFFVRTLDGQDD